MELVVLIIAGSGRSSTISARCCLWLMGRNSRYVRRARPTVSLDDYCHRNDYSSWGTRILAVNRCTICSVLALFSLIGGSAFLACSNDFKTPVHLAWNRADHCAA